MDLRTCLKLWKHVLKMHPKEFKWWVAKGLMQGYIGAILGRKKYLQNAEVSLIMESPIDQDESQRTSGCSY